MHRVERPTTKRAGLPQYAAAILSLLAVLVLPAAARAQWTSSSGNTTTTDNVGIGTTAPAGKLDIQAPPTATPLILFRQGSAAGEAVQLGVFNAPGSSGSTIFNVARLMAGTNGVNSAASYIEFQPINTNGSGWASGLSVKAGGFVGVGTASPTAKLQVAGDIMASGTLSSGRTGSGVYLWDDGTGGNVGALSSGTNARDLSVQGQNLIFFSGATYAEKMRITSGGNVGVGTAGPTTRLTVTDGATPYAAGATDLLQLKRGTTNGADTGGTSILFANASNGFRIKYGGTSDRLSFLDGGSVEILSLANGGNVGVGTTTPAVKLDVNAGSSTAVAINATGAINASGAITGATVNAKYQDVAEWVPSTQKLAAGTVVVLDTSKTNHVLASTKTYDTGVAGVVSDSPGVILGQAGSDKVKVATTGRVKVRVDATRAPIHVGDLLVTSDTEGVAMKSVPVDLGGVQIHRPGTIIGKALEPLEKGTGEILVLLSLQ
jgi:Peptidase_G2, IMC autoproteolytic cleavage domain